MKKIILLVGVLLTFGCSVKVNISIKDDMVTEEFQLLTEATDGFSKGELYSLYREEYPIYIDEEFDYMNPYDKKNWIEYYDKHMLDTDYGYQSTYTSKYNFSNYSKSRLLNTAFKNFNISYNSNENAYYFYATNLIVYNNQNKINNIRIRINLNDYEIIDENAHSKDGNVLTWEFNKDSISQSIVLKYKAKGTVNNQNNENINNNQNEKINPEKQDVDTTGDLILVLALFLSFILVLIGILFARKKFTKNK